MGILFGSRFEALRVFLKYCRAAMAALAVLSIVISFNLVRGKTGFIYSLAGSCVLLQRISVFHPAYKR
jgi:hypothetical protein